VNNFVSIKPFKTFEKVNYYTLQIEGATESETDKFFNRFEHETELEEDLNNLVAWLEEIGERRGAKSHLFRFEESAGALPPPQKFLAELPVNDLRLYCVRISDEIVILANGGVKTSQTVQDSLDLLPMFRFANQVAKRITEMIKYKELRYAGNTIIDCDKIEIEI
jgi:hypothetical protein